jgi:hypothetical protein
MSILEARARSVRCMRIALLSLLMANATKAQDSCKMCSGNTELCKINPVFSRPIYSVVLCRMDNDPDGDNRQNVECTPNLGRDYAHCMAKENRYCAGG